MRLAADTKTCSRCKAEKILDAFSTNRAMTDGKNIYCRACLSEADKARRKKMAESPRPSVTEKKCVRCSTVKPASEYARNKSSTTGLQSYCKSCTRGICLQRIEQGIRPPPFKECSVCGKTLPASKYHRNRAVSTTLAPACKDCSRRRVRCVKYRLTNEWLDKIDAATQCEICDQPIDGPQKHLDHDHATGAPRGVLCTKCNAMLGFARDSQKILSSACQYLSRFHFTAGVQSRAS